VVHPGAGNPEGTLLNALLHRAPELRPLARAGIVHRLDKETSGLMVVARTEAARLDLIEQLSARSVEREYLALLSGTLISGGTVDAPIGRHPRERTRMAVHASGRAAVSHYRVEKRYRAHTLVRVNLESGRTHQIRVHMAHIGHGVLGDRVYGGAKAAKISDLPIPRQMLHAESLSLLHPETRSPMTFMAPPPKDMAEVIEKLRAATRGTEMQR
jgi:23S rRNA pseudouridine1911/1915/1917 synthase